LLRSDHPSALIEKTWGSGEKPRYTATLADGSETHVRAEGVDTYTFSAGQQVMGRLTARSRSTHRPEYDLELAPLGDQVMIVATSVVIARIRRDDPNTAP
jgi:hypothetical protein